MGIYEDNLKILQNQHPDLYSGIYEETDRKIVSTCEALNGERVLTINMNGKEYLLSSFVNPTHHAFRFVSQFDDLNEEFAVLLFGLCDGKIVRELLKNAYLIKCIIYEPSLAIFQTVLHEYKIEDILEDDKCVFVVEGLNQNYLKEILFREINYNTLNCFQIASLFRYDDLFVNSYTLLEKAYHNAYVYKKADIQTMVQFAKSNMENEIHAMEWFPKCKAIRDLKYSFPKEIPCIIVAAGPSLEKNVEVLKQAKGKALIICVDSALPFLLGKQIIPDMVSTFDPQKGVSYFESKETKRIPFVVNSTTDYHILEKVCPETVYYVSVSNDFYEKLFENKGKCVETLDGGGSVGTISFQLAVELGFQKIILIGQDLAFTDNKAHAGKGTIQESDLIYDTMEVDGYYGEPVLTRSDFRDYIEWYNSRIPSLKQCTVVNATEGGAKLCGTIQMSLEDAIEKFCSKEYPISKMLDGVSLVWKTKEEVKELLETIAKKYNFYIEFYEELEKAISNVKEVIGHLQNGIVRKAEQEQISDDIKKIMNIIQNEDSIFILISGILETEFSLTSDLKEENADIRLETIRLYKKVKCYFEELLNATGELVPIWKTVMDKICFNYHLEENENGKEGFKNIILE